MPTTTFDASNTLPAYRRIAAAAALVTAALGALVLAGWAAGGEALARASGRGPMLPETAAGLVMAAASLWLLRDGSGRRARTVGLALCAAVLAMGTVLLVLGATRLDLGTGRILFSETVARVSGPGRRMGTNTAAGLALAGLALALAARETRRGWRASQLLAAACTLIAFLALVGHLYGVRSLYTAGSVTGGMSLPTAVALVTLGIGAFFARPGHGYAALVTGTDASGVLARQLLPAAIVVPVGLGYLWLHVRREGFLEREPAVSLFAIVLVAVFSALVFRAAAAVADVDREREASLLRERRARAEAEEANRAKMDFLAVMSHELRTPLNAIAGYAELVEMGIHGPVTDEQVAALGKIRRSQRHLLLLINDVLNFAKIEAGRLEVRLAEVPVRDLVAGVETLILPQAEQRGLRYERRLADEGLRACADPDKAGQVLLNLLSNAVKFTGPGGEVRLEGGLASGRVRLAVRDTGPGIPPERLESIFEPFVQLERGLAAQREGTGLGLAISRDLARAMGGDVWAESTPGKGSVFTLELPLAPLPADPAPRAGGAEDAAPEERRALRHASGR